MTFVSPSFPTFPLPNPFVTPTFPPSKKGQKPSFPLPNPYFTPALLHPPYPPVRKAPALGRGAFP